MASRVCNRVVISSSAAIAQTFAEVDEYLSKGGTTGTLMLAMALVSWYWYAAATM